MYAGKSKVMTGSSGGTMIVNSLNPVGKECRKTLVQCTVCIKWINKRCNGVCGDLSLIAEGFRCKRCDRTIQEADLAGDLVVDGETYV